MTNAELRNKNATSSYAIRASSFLRHWSFGFRHFDLVPDLIQLGEIDIAQLLTARPQFFFQQIEPPDEFVRRRMQRGLRVEFAFARQINDCEKQIADLVFDGLLLFALDRIL